MRRGGGDTALSKNKKNIIIRKVNVILPYIFAYYYIHMYTIHTCMYIYLRTDKYIISGVFLSKMMLVVILIFP